MNALNTTLSGVSVAVFDCSKLPQDIRRGVEAMLSPLHPSGACFSLGHRLLEKADATLLGLSFRQRAGAFHLWFLRRESGVVQVGEMRAAGLVGD